MPLILLPVPAAILPQLQSPLLRLPGEIRNKIYEYALEDSKPLEVIGNLYCYAPPPFKAHATRLHQFNELQHTCRQLRTETGYMGFSRTKTSFYSESLTRWQVPQDPGTRRVMCYENEKHDHHLHYLISLGPIRHYTGLCEEDPQVEVHMFTQVLRKDLGCRGLLVRGAALQLILRGKKLPFRVDAGIASDIESMAVILNPYGRWSFHAEPKLLPKNIRIYPMEEYDEAEVRYSYLRNKKGFEDWVAQIREWYKNGI